MKDCYYMLYCPLCGSTNVEMQMWVNPNTNDISGDCLGSGEGDDCWCCECEEHVDLATLPELWKRFEDVTVNSDDEIEQDFLSFPAGTSKFDVWHWFDERCPNNLHDDLMFNDNEDE